MKQLKSNIILTFEAIDYFQRNVRPDIFRN